MGKTLFIEIMDVSKHYLKVTILKAFSVFLSFFFFLKMYLFIFLYIFCLTRVPEYR